MALWDPVANPYILDSTEGFTIYSTEIPVKENHPNLFSLPMAFVGLRVDVEHSFLKGSPCWKLFVFLACESINGHTVFFDLSLEKWVSPNLGFSRPFTSQKIGNCWDASGPFHNINEKKLISQLPPLLFLSLVFFFVRCLEKEKIFSQRVVFSWWFTMV